MLLELGLVYVRFCSIIEAQVLDAVDGLYCCSHAAYAFVAGRSVLYLAHLYAESAQLHLIVNAAHEFQFPFCIVTNQVARMVHLGQRVAIAKGLQLTGKRYFGKSCLGQVLTMPVALRHLNTD